MAARLQPSQSTDGPRSYGRRRELALPTSVKSYKAALGTTPGPSQVLLVLDGDDTSGSVGSTHGNWPDPEDNHGAAGTCMNFCDGHAEFIKRSRYLQVFDLSQDGNSVAPIN